MRYLKPACPAPIRKGVHLVSSLTLDTKTWEAAYWGENVASLGIVSSIFIGYAPSIIMAFEDMKTGQMSNW